MSLFHYSLLFKLRTYTFGFLSRDVGRDVERDVERDVRKDVERELKRDVEMGAGKDIAKDVEADHTCLPLLCPQQKELQIRRQFHDTVKIQQKQYKALKEQVLATLPKVQQKATIKKLKEEQMRKMAMLGQQYENSIAEMMQQQNVGTTRM